jgi:integrase/recombinase XerD
MGLKRFFNGIKKLAPGYVSPFEVMDDRLARKLSRTKRSRTKKALTVREIQDLLSWLRKDQSSQGKTNYAVVFMLVTSGLRAAELCSLRWKDLSCVDGTWTGRFTGKGEKEAEQELYPSAVKACEEQRRNGGEYLFYSHQWDTANRSWSWEPLKPHGLWFKISQIGKKARVEGVIRRDLQFSPHLFRRSYATALYQSGMKLKAIMEKTRHTNIEVLARHYISDEEPAAPYFDKVLGAF